MAVLPQKDKEFRLERLKFKLLADEKVVEQLTSFERLAVNQDFKVFLEALKSAFDKKITDYDTGKKVFFSSSMSRDERDKLFEQMVRLSGEVEGFNVITELFKNINSTLARMNTSMEETKLKIKNIEENKNA